MTLIINHEGGFFLLSFLPPSSHPSTRLYVYNRKGESMEITIVAKLSVTQDSASTGVDPKKAIENDDWDEWKKLLVAGLLKNLKGEAVKVKSGVFENLVSGTITEIKEIKQKGKILYP